ncbi:MAG: small subunit ribosomal protein S8 [Planctomycetota bacterium]|jgi:small subunit ribosomal protein S8
MMTDPIADMLTRIRNANSIRRPALSMPASRMRVSIAQVLKDEGFITSYDVVEGKPSSSLNVTLKYGQDGEQVIRKIDRVSTPGRRVYMGIEEIKPVLSGQGITILSTNKGVLSDRKAREEKVGGEILCTVY